MALAVAHLSKDVRRFTMSRPSPARSKLDILLLVLLGALIANLSWSLMAPQDSELATATSNKSGRSRDHVGSLARSWVGVLGITIAIGLRFKSLLNYVVEESLTVVRNQGITLTSRTVLGQKKYEFFGVERMSEVVINEGIHHLQFVFYVAFLLKDQTKLVLAFEHLLPKLDECRIIYLESRYLLFGASNFLPQEGTALTSELAALTNTEGGSPTEVVAVSSSRASVRSRDSGGPPLLETEPSPSLRKKKRVFQMPLAVVHGSESHSGSQSGGGGEEGASSKSGEPSDGTSTGKGESKSKSDHANTSSKSHSGGGDGEGQSHSTSRHRQKKKRARKGSGQDEHHEIGSPSHGE